MVDKQLNPCVIALLESMSFYFDPRAFPNLRLFPANNKNPVFHVTTVYDKKGD